MSQNNRFSESNVSFNISKQLSFLQRFDDPQEIMFIWKSSSSCIVTMERIDRHFVFIIKFVHVLYSSSGFEFDVETQQLSIFWYLQNGYVQYHGCETGTERNIIIAATLNGAVTALDGDTGEMLWRYQGEPLLQGSLATSEPIDIGGNSLQIMPTLDGRLYSYTLNTNIIEPMVITTDSLLESTMRLGQDAVAGGKSVTTKGFDFYTGEVKYECSMESCGNQDAELPENPVLLVKRVTNSIRARDKMRGVKRWNLSTAEIDVSLAGGMSVSAIPASDVKVLLQPPDGILVAVNKHNREEWKTDVHGHIVSVWQISGNTIGEISMFDPRNIFTFQFEVMHRDQHNMQSHTSLLYIGTHTPFSFPFIIQSPKAKKNLEKKMSMLQEPSGVAEVAGPRFCSANDDSRSLAYNSKHETLKAVLRQAFQSSQSKAIEDKSPSATCPKVLQVIAQDAGKPVQYLGTENMRSTSLSQSGDYGYLRTASSSEDRIVRISDDASDVSGSTKSVPVKRALLPVEKLNVSLGSAPRVHFQKQQAKTDIDTDDSQLSSDDKKRLLRNRTISRSSQEGFTSRFANEFEVKKVIGYGGFGIVFRAQSITDMNEYAVKRIAVADNDKARNRVLREARALAMFDHPGIIRYFYAWEERPPKGYQDKEDEAFLGMMEAEKPSVVGYTGDTDASYQEAVSSSSDGIVFCDGPNEGFKKSRKETAEIDEQSSIHNEAMLDETENEELEVRQRNDTGDCAYLYIVMQLCAETMEDWIERSATIESRPLIVMKSWIRQLASGLEYLHEKGYIHRDLKPGNIFFSLDSKPGHKILKIGDLGLVTKTDGAPKSALGQDSGSSFKHTANVGTASYMSPEQIARQSYTEKVDIFALGLVAAEIIFPFSTASERIHVCGSLQKGEVPEILDSCPPESRDFLLQMTSLNPANRPSASELATHPFLQ